MPITALPTPPLPTDTPADFNTKAFALLGALPTFVTEANALETAVEADATTATTQANLATTQANLATTQANLATTQANSAATSANTASTKANEASNSAAAAETSRIEASKLNLGSKTTAPTLDNQGAVLLAGATYYDTTLNKWRVWTGAAWGDGISAVAGVSSINGQTGAVTGYVTETGSQTLTNKTLTSPIVSGVTLNDGYTEEVFALTGTTPALSASNGSIQTWTLSGNSTPTDSLASGQSLILGITAGANTVTWPSVTWSKVGGSGTAPTLTSTGVNWIVLWKINSTLRGAFLGTA